MPEEPWIDIARRKREQQSSRIPKHWRLKSLPASTRYNVIDIPKTCGILTEEEIRITESKDATALLGELVSGRLKSADVVLAFCKRAAVAQQLTDCLTEIFFDDALKRAKELDEHLSTTGKPLGPLHGLPISLKDNFNITGYDACVGFAALCFKEAKETTTLATALLRAGAVLYCKTNVPMGMQSFDSHNNVFGRVLNPYNVRLSAGGSSGGEAALLALRGSILGIGSDTAGSLRVPAMCCNLYTINPSLGRVSSRKQAGGLTDGSQFFTIRSGTGPLAHSLRDCELLMRVIADLELWNEDHDVVPQTWAQMGALTIPPIPSRQDVVRIGILRTDGLAPPLPPVSKLLDEVVNRLSTHSTSGLPAIEVVELNITALVSQCLPLINKFFAFDGANDFLDTIESTREPLSPWFVPRVKRHPRGPVDTLAALHLQRNQLMAEFVKIWTQSDKYWGRRYGNVQGSDATAELDAFICPVAPHPVPEPDKFGTHNYTSAWVLLDLPGATLPVRRMQAADLKDEIDKSRTPIGRFDKHNRTLWDDVDRSIYLDSPLCVQVVGKRLQERKLLGVVDVMDRILRDSETDGPKL